MLIIGLTGGIGCGKTTVSDYFASLSVKIIDADVIVRELLTSNTQVIQAITQHFDAEVILNADKLDHENNKFNNTTDIVLNRRYLRQLIFTNIEAKTWLEDLLHPLVYNKIDHEIQQIKTQETNNKQYKYCIVVIPLLYETLTAVQYKKLFDRILVVIVDEKIQITRTMQRDFMQKTEIEAILKSQINNQQRLALADDIIYNNASIDALYQQINVLHEVYMQQQNNLSKS